VGKTLGRFHRLHQLSFAAAGALMALVDTKSNRKTHWPDIGFFANFALNPLFTFRPGAWRYLA